MDSKDRYYEYWRGKWWWFSSRIWDWVPQTGREPSDGGRYPAVNMVILTDASFEYAMGEETITDPPQDSSPDRVIEIKDMKHWETDWDKAAPYNKLLVYEFYDKNSSLYKAMDKLLEKLAKQYKNKVDFRKLDVDNFEFLARLCGVEGAYPTFVLFKNGKQVGKVVGLKEDELQRSIKGALNKYSIFV